MALYRYARPSQGTCMLRITHCKHSKVIRVETSLKTERAQTLKMKLNLPMREIKKNRRFQEKKVSVRSFLIQLNRLLPNNSIQKT